MKPRSFFRWMPTAIFLWLLVVLFTFGAGLSLWMARQAALGATQNAMIGDSQHLMRWFVRCAVGDIAAAALCVVGWFLMRQRVSGKIALGAIAVMGAALIVFSGSAYWMCRGASFEYWCDSLVELPFLVYAIIYAYQECRKVAA
jgi:hypothetical protein